MENEALYNQFKSILTEYDSKETGGSIETTDEDDIVTRYFKSCDTTVLENMMQMLDPANSIVIDNNIGIMGFWKREHNTKKEDNVIAKLTANGNIKKRGDFYRVLTSDGVIPFDEYITGLGIIFKDDNTKAYIFILKDYKATQDIDVFFDSKQKSEAVLILDNDKIYVNNVKDNELKVKYEYDKSITIEREGLNEYRLIWRNCVYRSYSVNKDNNIGIFRTVKMRL